MTYTKLVLAICFTALALAHVSRAQSCPQEWLDSHNAVRAEVGVPPLVWDDTVAAYAHNYANERAGDCAMQHSGGPYGENIAKAWEELRADGCMTMWAGEKKDYDYDTNSCYAEMCLHYTQVVWRDSLRLGCATANCSDGYVFATCNYDPPGNWIGLKPY